jgi:hypothetical protein
MFIIIIIISYYGVLTMVYNTQSYWIFGLCPSSDFEITKKTQRFGNWICFRPQVREDAWSVGSLRKIQFPKRCVFLVGPVIEVSSF